MNKDAFWIFVNLGLGDAIVSNAIFRHYAKLHEDKLVIIPCWEHNLASIQWMLSDVPNIFFYPIDTEHQLLTCRDGINPKHKLCIGFYEENKTIPHESIIGGITCKPEFNPVLWDSEFYRQAGLDPELKWSGFKLPEFIKNPTTNAWIAIDDEKKERPYCICHQDEDRGFTFKEIPKNAMFLHKEWKMMDSCCALYLADEIHVIDSSMLNLSDLMPTPYCKRFVFHRYARKGLPPQLKKNWEIID